MAKAIGIDMGADALRGVVIQGSKGKLELLSAGNLPLGELANLEDNEDKRIAVGEKLKELVRGAKLRGGAARLAVSGPKTELRYLMVPPVPPWRLEMLVKYEVEERGSDKSAKTCDYRILDVPDVGGQYTVLLGTCQESETERLLEACAQAKLGEVEIDLEALALFNAYYHGHGFDPEATVLVVDIGAEEVTVLLVRKGSLYHARTFVGAGRRFSEVLADTLKIDPLMADEFKKREGEIRFDLAQPATRAMRTGRTGLWQPRRTRIASVKPGESAFKPGEAPAPGAPTGRMPAPPDAPAGSGPLRDDLQVPVPQEESTVQSSDEALDDLELAPQEDEAPKPEETPAEQRARQVSTALVKEAAALCAALENVVSNVRTQTKQRDLKVDTVLITGAGSRLKGLNEFIGRRLQAKVEALDIFRKIDLSRLPPEAAENLRKEQDQMAVCTGVALSALCKGGISFLLWPQALKERKEFRARGAFLYYAAAALAAAMVLFWLTPSRNAEILAQNMDRARERIVQAQDQDKKLRALKAEEEELRKRLEQIERNVDSGNFFLKVLDQLRDFERTPQETWLTSVSTTLPSVVRAEYEVGEKNGAGAGGIKEPGAKDTEKKPLPGEAPDTFQAQAKVFLRGFVRSAQKEDLLLRIMSPYADSDKPGFGNLLVPKPGDPSHARNLFSDIRALWHDGRDYPQGPRFLKEFVLEAYVGEAEEKPGKPVRQQMPEVAAAPAGNPSPKAE